MKSFKQILLLLVLISLGNISYSQSDNVEKLLAFIFPSESNTLKMICSGMRDEVALDSDFKKPQFNDINLAWNVAFDICDEIQLSNESLENNVIRRLEVDFTTSDIKAMIVFSERTGIFGSDLSSDIVNSAIVNLRESDEVFVNSVMHDLGRMGGLIQSETLKFWDAVFLALPERLDNISPRLKESIKISKTDDGDYVISSAVDKHLSR